MAVGLHLHGWHEPMSRPSDTAFVENPTHDIGSTLRRQLGILMDVHSVLLPGHCVLDTLSFLGRD